MEQDIRIDFAGIGARKSASTWVYGCLSQHPEVNCARKNAGFFFDPPSLGPQHYRALFDPDGSGLNCDFTDGYLYDCDVARRIHRFNPEMRIVVSLRNPVQVMYSAFVFAHSGLGTAGSTPDFDEYLSRGSWLGVPAKEMGFLAKHLAAYRELFSPHQVHAILFDDICSQPVAVVQSLYKFLGVGAEFQPAQGRGIVNESTVIRSRGFASMARSVVRGIKAVRLGWLAENAFVMSLYRRINKKRPPPLDADMWAHLWELYRDDVHSLGNLLDRDLEAWGRPPATEGMA